MSHLSHASARSSRSSSPASPAPKRRATSSARRELWLRGGYSSDDDDRPSDSDSRGGSANPEDAFAQPPPDDNPATFSYLGKSCVVINSPEANQFLCGFQLQGSDKTCFNPKCTIRSHRIPEAASPVLRPGVYFRTSPSGISASRIWNLPVADLSILELFSDLLSRVLGTLSSDSWSNWRISLSARINSPESQRYIRGAPMRPTVQRRKQ